VVVTNLTMKEFLIYLGLSFDKVPSRRWKSLISSAMGLVRVCDKISEVFTGKSLYFRRLLNPTQNYLVLSEIFRGTMVSAPGIVVVIILAILYS
jgi:hypothetical protein